MILFLILVLRLILDFDIILSLIEILNFMLILVGRIRGDIILRWLDRGAGLSLRLDLAGE